MISHDNDGVDRIGDKDDGIVCFDTVIAAESWEHAGKATAERRAIGREWIKMRDRIRRFAPSDLGVIQYTSRDAGSRAGRGRMRAEEENIRGDRYDTVVDENISFSK